MRFVIDFDDERDKEYIDFIKGLSREEKTELRDKARDVIIEAYEDEERRKEQEEERRKLRVKQRQCQHDYQEDSRNRGSDEEEYDSPSDRASSRVFYICKKCDDLKIEWEF